MLLMRRPPHLLEAFGEVHRLLPRSVSVQVRAHVFNLHLQPLLRSLFGAFERQVLEEMRGTVVLRRFVARPSVDPHPDSRSLPVPL